MDEIKKALKRLTEKERKKVKEIVEKIRTGDFRAIDIKKLKRKDDIFRVLKRILESSIAETKKILAIERRFEKMYR